MSAGGLLAAAGLLVASTASAELIADRPDRTNDLDERTLRPAV